MAPYSNSDLPKGTQYFIGKHQLIKSTGIELEDDGQVIKLHPDLNGTKADLFSEYPLRMSLKDIKLEIYLNSTKSAQWSSSGTAKFCFDIQCSPIKIDEMSEFFGTLKNFIAQPAIERLSPLVKTLSEYYIFKNAIVKGSLLDIYNSEVIIIGEINVDQEILCDQSLQVYRKMDNDRVQKNLSIDFESILELKIECYKANPSYAIEKLITPSFPNYNQLLRLKEDSLLMNERAAKFRVKHKFVKKCRFYSEKTHCDPKSLNLPELVISIWSESDEDSIESSVNISVYTEKIEFSSKRLSSIKTLFSGPDSSKLTNVGNIMDKFNLTEARNVSIFPSTNEFNVQLNSVDQGKTCMKISGLSFCNWEAVLKLQSNSDRSEKCSNLKISGLATSAFDNSSFGNVNIDVSPNCHGESQPNFLMNIEVNEQSLLKIFSHIFAKLNYGSSSPQLLDSTTHFKSNSIKMLRLSNDITNFLSDKIPNPISGEVWSNLLNSYIPFSLLIDTNKKIENTFKNLCFFLNQNSSNAFLSKTTLASTKHTPKFLEESSVCMNGKTNHSDIKQHLEITIPITSVSSCKSNDLVCQFLYEISGSDWTRLMLHGYLRNGSIALRTPITPTGILFSLMNLNTCSIIHNLSKSEKPSIIMECFILFKELGQPLPIVFLPKMKNHSLIIIAVIRYVNIEYPYLFGLEQFRYRSIYSSFIVQNDLNFITLYLNIFYTVFGPRSNLQPPSGYIIISLKHPSKSLLHLTIPPFPISTLTQVVGFGDCPTLSSVVTDILEEWEIKIVNLPFNISNRSFQVIGLNLAQNSLFNSTIQVSNTLQLSRMILRGIKNVIVPINSINQQAKFSSYSDETEGPTIVINLECACENICEDEKFGSVISTVEFFGINSPLNINITNTLPWAGKVFSHTFLGQRLKTNLLLEMNSLEGPLDISGVILDTNRKVVQKLQSRIFKNAKHIINKMLGYEKELDDILRVLNKIRSEKIDLQIKSEELKKGLDHDTINQIVYETSLNLTCKEEVCERVCVGCASTIGCASKDILGSCVTLSNWDLNCGCGRDTLCLLYNDACDEIIEMAKLQLKTFSEKRTNRKSFYEYILKKFEETSRDEAKTELLYSSAMKLTFKALKEMRHKLNEANAVTKDIPIIKWLKVNDIRISLYDQTNGTINSLKSRTISNFCIYLRLVYTNRKEKENKKWLKYCPYSNGKLIDHVVTEIAKDLFPNIYSVSRESETFSTKDIMGVDTKGLIKNRSLNRIENLQKNIVSHSQVEEVLPRARRNNIQEMYMRKVLHPTRIIDTRFTLSKISNESYLQNGKILSNDLDHDESNWMIPDNMKGRCRVLVNVIDILHDLLRTIHQLTTNQEQSRALFQKQKDMLSENKEYYLEKLVESGDLLNLVSGPQNATFHQTISSFSNGAKLFVSNLEKSLTELEDLVIKEWRRALSERIRKMGGRGIGRFIQNLYDVIKSLLEPKEEIGSMFSQIEQQNSAKIMQLVKNIGAVLLDEGQSIDIYKKLKTDFQDAKKLRKLIKSSCR